MHRSQQKGMSGAGGAILHRQCFELFDGITLGVIRFKILIESIDTGYYKIRETIDNRSWVAWLVCNKHVTF